MDAQLSPRPHETHPEGALWDAVCEDLVALIAHHLAPPCGVPPPAGGSVTASSLGDNIS